MANLKQRAEMVKAMEVIARSVNNESIFWNMWATMGVADGDIMTETSIEEILECYDSYLEDDNFKDLMTLFLRMMWKASQNGGLYCDGIVSAERQVEWR